MNVQKQFLDVNKQVEINAEMILEVISSSSAVGVRSLLAIFTPTALVLITNFNPNPLNVGYLFSNKISTEKLNCNFMFDFCQIL